MSKTKVIYHAIDLDGWCSAAIAAKYYRETGEEFTMIGYNYGDSVPKFKKDDKIVMLDISFQIETMIKFQKQIVWIDHHKSAIIAAAESGVEFEGKLPVKTYSEDGQLTNIQTIAACELAWEYFYPEIPIPQAVRLLGKYDSFRFDRKTEMYVLYFQFAARTYIDSPCGCNQLFGRFYDTAPWIRQGELIYKYLCMEAKAAVDEIGFALEIAGYNFLAINKSRFNLASFGIDYHSMGYDGVACFHYSGRSWVFSFYNENGEVDCSEIAKEFGGGGHAGAAGCRMNHNQFVTLLQGIDTWLTTNGDVEAEDPALLGEQEATPAVTPTVTPAVDGEEIIEGTTEEITPEEPANPTD